MDFIYCLTLPKLRATTSEQSLSHLRQIRALGATYESLILQDPYLPPPDSPLPALLALRSTQNCIDETIECIAKTEIDFKKTQKRLEEEQSDLNEAKLIQTAIERRTVSILEDLEKRSRRTPSQIAREMVQDMKNKKAHYDRETGRLVQAFNTFVDDHLAPMLAAEELGGPVVGEAMDIDEDMLEAGFNAHGKTKRVKNITNKDKRQLRIDDVFGPRAQEDGEEPWDKKTAAAVEMRELTEALLNSIIEAAGGGPGAYVVLTRESAAARFLVRSKVAQFHPKDARRLRLVDFGRELED
jgi:hypothetical protein